MREYYSERPERSRRGHQDLMMANGPCRWLLLFLLVAVLVLAIVAFATPYWAYVSLTGNNVAFNFGFFDVCRSSTCTRYLTFFNLERYSGEMVGCILFLLLAILSLTLALIFCFAYACVDVLRDCYRGGCGSEKQKIVACASFTLLGGFCELVSVVWFYINTIRNYNGMNTFRFLVSSAMAEYSLILASVSGGLAIVIGFLLFFYRFMMYYDDDDYIDDYPRKRTRYSPEPERRYPAPPPAPRPQPKLGSTYAMPDPVRLPDKPISMAPAAYRQKYGNQAPQVFRYTFKNDDDFWRYDQDKEVSRQDNGYRVYNGDRGNRY